MVFIGCNYPNLQKLGQGSYGTVSKCAKASTGEIFAKKTITPKAASNYRRRQLTFKEARIMQDLSGEDSIVKYKDFYEDVHGLHIVMEFCPGGNLGEEMENNGLFYPNQAGAIIAQLAQGLHTIHSKGYLHRDMKLENVLVEGICPITDVPKVKIADLGLAIPIRNGMKDNGFAGTLSYSALECLEGKFDPSTDMWALGVISYLLISGEFPHDPTAMDLDEAYWNIVQRRTLFMEDEWVGVPLEARKLINSLLMRTKEHRPSASEVLKNSWIKRCFNDFKYAEIRKMSKQNQIKSEFERKINKYFQQTVESAAFFERVENEARVEILAANLKVKERSSNSVQQFFDKVKNVQIPNSKNNWEGLRGVHMMVGGEEGDEMKDISEKDLNQERLRNEMHGVYVMRVNEDGDEVMESYSESQIRIMENKKERVSIKDLTAVLRKWTVKEEGERKMEAGGGEEEEEKIVMEFGCFSENKFESENNENIETETEFKLELEDVNDFKFDFSKENENEYEYRFEFEDAYKNENEYEFEYENDNKVNNSFHYYWEQESENFNSDDSSNERKSLTLMNGASVFNCPFITQEYY